MDELFGDGMGRTFPTSTALSMLMRLERIETTIGYHDQRISRMERHHDHTARGGRADIDWNAVLKLITALILLALGAFGVLTWPEATSAVTGLV
ncbi:hypothetical protein [Filomicrobium sp.]|uniref:hypothetical protein n=1 Tax=Filomicrobium sp. TaxID=2024831 RepID=UPI00258C182A|nr:hypothetical protein [Filomicrobium sp.]MCV0371722.1 hypothetical protein [Filomicrobium sp.]